MAYHPSPFPSHARQEKTREMKTSHHNTHAHAHTRTLPTSQPWAFAATRADDCRGGIRAPSACRTMTVHRPRRVQQQHPASRPDRGSSATRIQSARVAVVERGAQASLISFHSPRATRKHSPFHHDVTVQPSTCDYTRTAECLPRASRRAPPQVSAPPTSRWAALMRLVRMFSARVFAASGACVDSAQECAST